jgi:phosphate transport system ATP-binding protein
MAAIVQTQQLSCYFHGTPVIDNVTMTFPAKTITALIGPNGSGKSTLLRALNRMHELSPGGSVTGQVLLDDVDIYGPDIDAQLVRRSVGLVFPTPTPFPGLSIAQNVAAGLGMGTRVPRADDTVARALDAVGVLDELKDRLGEPAGRLPGGLAQLVCLARALAVDPQVILLDEPCRTLDPVSTVRFEDALLALKDAYTIVIVTHNLQQASRMSDRTAFFAGEPDGGPGVLIEHTSTRRLFTNPEHTQTEDYISGRIG